MLPVSRRRLGVSLLLGLAAIPALAGCQESGPVAIPSSSSSSASTAPPAADASAQPAAPVNSRIQSRAPQTAPRVH